MSDKDFTGSIPQFYDRHLGPLLFEPYARDMAQRLDGFEGALLEVAAGTGIVTEALDRSLPRPASILATDLNPEMLDHAATKFRSARVEWRQADGQALPFGEAAFDAVVCQFGVMFFPDRAAGYREARRVLRPGGRYIFNVWDELDANPVARITHDTVAALYPDDPPGFLGRTPFGYADKDRIRADLDAAGFGDVQIETVREHGQAASLHDVAVGYCHGTPLGAEILARDPQGVPGAIEAVHQALRERFGDGPPRSDLQALVIAAS